MNKNHLLKLFDDSLDKYPNKVAIVDYRTETESLNKMTYRQLGDKVNRISSGLIQLGVKPQDIVSFQIPNWWEFVAVQLACLRVRAIPNPLMTIFRERELQYMLEFAESEVVIAPRSFRSFNHEEMLYHLREKIPTLQHVIIIDGDGEDSFENTLMSKEANAIDASPKASDYVEMMYTSGTTGTPKGVLHNSGSILATLMTYKENMQLDTHDTFFMGAPLAHQTGFLYGMWLPLLLGSTMVYQDSWSADIAWKLIGEQEVSFTMGATPFLYDLLNSKLTQVYNSERFKTFVCGGAPVPRALVQEARKRMQVNIATVWGMTENGVVTSTKIDDSEEKLFSTDGRSLPGCQVRIVDQDGNEVPDGTEGRLLVCGDSMFEGYLKSQQSALDDKGWFDTGDLAKMDADKYIRITGRSKDILIRGGENIPVVEIENIIYTHDRIADVALVGMPHDRLGEIGCCFVTLKPDQALNLEDIQIFLSAKNVAKNYWPEHLEIIDELPRTPSGKIQKFKLRELARSLA